MNDFRTQYDKEKHGYSVITLIHESENINFSTDENECKCHVCTMESINLCDEHIKYFNYLKIMNNKLTNELKSITMKEFFSMKKHELFKFFSCNDVEEDIKLKVKNMNSF